MKARLLFAIAFGAALVALPTTALGSSSQAAANSQTYTDSTGEDAQAPDVTSVVVSNDDSSQITFKINISNRPALTSDMEIDILLDSDHNATTGNTSLLGTDYVIQLLPGSVSLFQWNGTGFFFAQSQTSLTYSYDATGATVHISGADLSGTHEFTFGVDAASGIVTDAQGNPDFTNSHDDLAPDPGHGLYDYKVISKIKLTQTAFTVSPAKAGKVFQASLAATQSDTGGPVTAGTVACSATVGGKALRSTHTLANGIASCVWHLPKTAKGKTLRGKISLTVQGTTLSKSFVAHVH
jgi:hypothetical protein